MDAVLYTQVRFLLFFNYFGSVAERLKALAWKASIGNTIAGSNPVTSAFMNI